MLGREFGLLYWQEMFRLGILVEVGVGVKGDGSCGEEQPHQRGPSTKQYLGGEAGCPVAPVLVPSTAPACVLAKLDGMVFEERGRPGSWLRHLGRNW